MWSKEEKNYKHVAHRTPTELIERLPKSTKVLLGTFSGMIATAVVHPLDVVKVRMQVREKTISTPAVMRMIIRCEGYRGLYAGLSAGLMRQATYTTTRLATYQMLHEYYEERYNLPLNMGLSSSEKVIIGVCAGLAGAFAGNPAEVALVRMMVDGPRLCSKRDGERRYKGVLHAFYRIVHEDGVRALWRGGSLTLARSVAVSFAQIGTYSEVSFRLKDKHLLEGFPAHVITSLASSFVTTMLSLPIDLIKTRYQVRRDKVNQMDILNDVLKRKGKKYLWKGITPYFIRMSIHTIMTLILFEYLAETFYREEDNKKMEED